MIILRNKEFAYKAGELEKQIKEVRDGHSLPKHNEKQLRHVLRKAGNLEKKKGVAATEDAVVDYGALFGVKKRRDRVTDRINEMNVIEARNNLRKRTLNLKLDRMLSRMQKVIR